MFQEHHDNESGYVGPFAEAISRAHEFTADGMTFFLAGMSYARKGGTLPEFKRIIARLLVEANLDDDALDHCAGAEKATSEMSAASSPEASGGGPIGGAQPRQEKHAAPARPSLSLASAMELKNDLAKSVFDTFKTRDGRAIGDVRYGELERLEKADKTEAAVFAAIRKHGVAPHDTKVRDLIKPKVLATIIKRAQG